MSLSPHSSLNQNFNSLKMWLKFRTLNRRFRARVGLQGFHEVPDNYEVCYCDLAGSDIDPYNYELMGIQIIHQPDTYTITCSGNYVWGLYLNALLEEILSVSQQPESVRIRMLGRLFTKPSNLIDWIRGSGESNFSVQIEFDPQLDGELIESLEYCAFLLLKIKSKID